MKRILVVDNDESTVDAIADLLRDTDYDALTATTGEQALTMLFRLRPDLLILDMFMPGVNGWQVLDAIAARFVARAHAQGGHDRLAISDRPSTGRRSLA